jgi:hydroxymethylbilane synthase
MLLPISIKIAARSSNLSKAQVLEVKELLKEQGVHVEFDAHLIDTLGDKDKTTSLKNQTNTNFFTKELDDLLLKGIVQATIHSAKDLPDPLPRGIEIVALTKGLSPLDCLVFKTLPKKNIRIGTSSKRREDMLKTLYKEAIIKDIRGTIEERLKLIDDGIVDGVVVAKCALTRLGLEHLNYIHLPISTHPMQGRLAILAREGDLEIKQLFARIGY